MLMEQATNRHCAGLIHKELKGFATFWEFSFYGKKRSLIMNIIVFLVKKFIFIPNFLILMSSNLCLFPQSCGLRK